MIIVSGKIVGPNGVASTNVKCLCEGGRAVLLVHSNTSTLFQYTLHDRMQSIGGLFKLFTEVASNDPTVAAVVSFVGPLLLLVLLPPPL